MLEAEWHQKYTNDLVLLSLSLTLNIFHTFSSIFIVDFEQVNIWWKCGAECCSDCIQI